MNHYPPITNLQQWAERVGVDLIPKPPPPRGRTYHPEPNHTSHNPWPLTEHWLTEREAIVLKRKYIDRATYATIAAEIGVTRRRVIELHNQAIRTTVNRINESASLALAAEAIRRLATSEPTR
jgi:hypothetical protein